MRDGLFIFGANRAATFQALTFKALHKLKIVISGAQEAWMVRAAFGGCARCHQRAG